MKNFGFRRTPALKQSVLKPIALCAALLTLLLSAQISVAQEVYRARLSPMPVTPQTVNDITGEGEVILTLNGNTLTVEGQFAGMSSAATAVHVHNGPPAVPGPVIGTLTVEQAATGKISGTLELSAEQIDELENNSLYIQVHSANNAAGELRGWIFLRSHFDNL